MKNWLRRIRGVIGMGLTWAVGWSAIGAVFGLVDAVVIGVVLQGIPLGAYVAVYVRIFATLGFFGGAIFSTVLRLAEGRRRFDELSLPRFAAWGGLGGLLLGVIALTGAVGAVPVSLGRVMGPMDFVVAGVATLLGAGSAAASLALARRADDQELLEAGEDIADVALTEKETQQLLGGMG